MKRGIRSVERDCVESSISDHLGDPKWYKLSGSHRSRIFAAGRSESYFYELMSCLSEPRQHTYVPLTVSGAEQISGGIFRCVRGKRDAQSRNDPNGQLPNIATGFTTKRPENRRNSTRINERCRNAKDFFLVVLALVESHLVTTNKTTHNPKGAGSNPVPATNEIKH